MEKVILDIKPKSFWMRLLINEVVLSFLLSSPLLIIIQESIHWNILIVGIIILVVTIIFVKEYEFYTYKISHKDNILQILYLKWNSKQVLAVNLLKIDISLSRHVRVRSVVNSIVFKHKKEILYKIIPRVRFFDYWTEKRVSELYDKLIETQNEVKARYENENIGS